MCVARNYAEHAKELGNAVPDEPFFFLKPTSSLLLAQQGGAVQLPFKGADVHYEVELGVVIGKDCKNVRAAEAMQHVAGYVLALDMTARCVQAQAKKQGRPWSEAKGYDTFCPISDFISKEAIPDPQDVRLRLLVNGVTKQDGSTQDMLFGVQELIGFCSSKMTLEAGDLLLTGTPKGVGPVRAGEEMLAEIPGVVSMRVPVKDAPSS